jgi:hypothetical protein
VIEIEYTKTELLEFDEIFELAKYIRSHQIDKLLIEKILENVRSFLINDWQTGNEKGSYLIKVCHGNVFTGEIVAYVTLSEKGMENLYKILDTDLRIEIRKEMEYKRSLVIAIGKIMHDAYKKGIRDVSVS